MREGWHRPPVAAVSTLSPSLGTGLGLGSASKVRPGGAQGMGPGLGVPRGIRSPGGQPLLQGSSVPQERGWGRRGSRRAPGAGGPLPHGRGGGRGGWRLPGGTGRDRAPAPAPPEPPPAPPAPEVRNGPVSVATERLPPAAASPAEGSGRPWMRRGRGAAGLGRGGSAWGGAQLGMLGRGGQPSPPALCSRRWEGAPRWVPPSSRWARTRLARGRSPPPGPGAAGAEPPPPGRLDRLPLDPPQ